MIVAAVAIFLCYQAKCGDLGNLNPYLRGHSQSVEDFDCLHTPHSALCGREVSLRGGNAESFSTFRQSSLNICSMKISPYCTMNRLCLRGGSGSRTSSTRKSAHMGNSKAAASSTDRVVYGAPKSKHASKHRSRPQESELSASEQSESSSTGSEASQSNESEDVVRDKRSKYAPPRRSKSEVVVQALSRNFH